MMSHFAVLSANLSAELLSKEIFYVYGNIITSIMQLRYKTNFSVKQLTSLSGSTCHMIVKGTAKKINRCWPSTINTIVTFSNFQLSTQWKNSITRCLHFTSFNGNVDMNSNSVGNSADFGRCNTWFNFSSDSMCKMNHKTVGRSTSGKELYNLQ
jgi:hypothetical protein